MNTARRLGLASFSLAIVTAAFGCADRTPLPTVPAPPASTSAQGPVAAPAEPECASDADCAAGLTCQQEIRAACETCDGGPLVHVCRPPKS